MVVVTCLFCDKGFSLDALLSAIVSYSPGTDTACSRCPLCGHDLELQVGSGEVRVGFTYWAGSFHFERVSVYAVRGLHRIEAAGCVEVELDGVRYALSRPSKID